MTYLPDKSPTAVPYPVAYKGQLTNRGESESSSAIVIP